MTIHMAENIKEERLRWVKPIAHGQTTITEVMKLFPHGKRTLERWLAAYLAKGADGLEPKSTRPKTSPKETPIAMKEQVIALRKKKKLCALKLHWIDRWIVLTACCTVNTHLLPAVILIFKLCPMHVT